MSYLERLKQEVEQRKQQELTIQQQQAQQQKVFETQIRPAIRRLHKYLYELRQYLNDLQLNTRVRYDLEGCGTLDDLKQTNYMIGGHTEAENRFFLRFECVNAFPFRVKKNTEHEMKWLKEYLWKHNLRFTCTEEQENYRFVYAIFDIQALIYAEFEFIADLKNAAIDLMMKNFPQLGKNLYTLQPQEINEQFLDELAKYILREPSALKLRKKHELSVEQRARLDRDKQEKDRQDFNNWLESTKENLEKSSKKGILNILHKDVKDIFRK